MSGKYLMIATAITTALLFSAGAYAGGGMGGGMGGGQGMMGGQDHGMMGGGGNGMISSDPYFSNPWTSTQSRKSSTDQNTQLEREKLREDVREKIQELSELYRSDKPDKALIDQKIAELNELETAYDRSVSEAN